MSEAMTALGARPLATGRADQATGREPARESKPGASRAPVAFAALLNAAMQPKTEGAVKVEGEVVTDGDAATEAGRASADATGAFGTLLPTLGATARPEQNAEGAGGRAAESAEPGAGSPGSADSAASASSAFRSTETPATAPSSSTAAHRGTESLVPEMRDRLERVIDRMREEHGHSVTVVETFRSQARQDQLHAQGRTAPGPVVTWTRSSKHTLGRAVDVQVNGTYDDPKGYATLQRIAQEEGLRTLGARDAGHLELPAHVAGRGTPDGRAAADTLPLPGARAERIEIVPAAATPAARAVAAPQPVPAGGVAPVAAVAQVAQVARVARIATVGAPGAPRASAPGGRVAAAESREQRIAHLATRAEREQETAAEGTLGELLAGAGEEQARGLGGEGRQSSFATAVRGADAAQPAQGVAGADAIARLDRIEALREGAAARPLSHITLRIDGADGTEDRIRVGLRGNTLGASLELSDAVLAERVGARIGELQQALERQGLEAEALQVRRGAGAVPEAIETARVASVLLERESSRGAGSQHTGGNASQQQHTGGSSRDQRDGRPSPDTPSRDESDSRHRSRREPKGER